MSLSQASVTVEILQDAFAITEHVEDPFQLPVSDGFLLFRAEKYRFASYFPAYTDSIREISSASRLVELGKSAWL